MDVEKVTKASMGAVFAAAGLGLGYLMLQSQDRINADYPLAVALLFPLVFVLAGGFLVADAFGGTVVSGRFMAAICLAFVAILNWYAFFVPEHTCTESVALFGVQVLSRRPGAAVCDLVIVVVALGVDVLTLVAVFGGAWYRRRQARLAALEPTKKWRSWSQLP